MTFTIVTTIRGETRPPLEPFTIEGRAQRRAAARMTVKAPLDDLIEPGELVSVRVDGVKLFGGIVEKPVERWPTGEDYALWDVVAVDFTALADQRAVTRAFTGQTAGDIVRDIIDGHLGGTPILDDQGVTYDAGSIDDGPTVDRAAFQYAYCSQAFDALAERVGHCWWIDENRKLWFKAKDAVVAPWTVTRADTEAGVVVDGANPDYRNRQYVLGGTAQTATQTETMPTDGKAQTWVTAYPVDAVPTVRLNTVAQTVGIRGVDTGQAFYWSRGTTEISQDAGGTPPGSGDDLEVEYVGRYPVVTLLEDAAEIDRRSRVNPTATGVVDAVSAVAGIETRLAGFEVAAGRLGAYSQAANTVKFRTRRAGLRVGQTVTFSLPAEDGWPRHRMHNRTALITSTRATVSAGDVVYDIVCSDGPAEQTFAGLFGALRTADTVSVSIGVGENEAVSLLWPYTDTLVWSDAVTFTPVACWYPSETTFPSDTRFLC